MVRIAGLARTIDLGWVAQVHLQDTVFCRGEVADYVLMPGRGFGFVTYTDAAAAQAFLEVPVALVVLLLSWHIRCQTALGWG